MTTFNESHEIAMDPHGLRVGGLSWRETFALPPGPDGVSRYRVCAGPCRRRLAAAEFLPNPKLQGGLGSYCRDCRREKKRQWRAAHPEEIAAYNESRRKPLVELECTECGTKFEGRPHGLVCSRRCKDRRYRRLHPDQVKAKERRKAARRRVRKAA